MEVTIYYLRSTLRLDILKPLTLATYYEKNCFVLNHGLNRHRVCRFLCAKTGNNGNFDHGGDYESLAIAYTEETHSQEESAQDRGVAVGRRVARRHRIAVTDAIKEKAEVGR